MPWIKKKQTDIRVALRQSAESTCMVRVRQRVGQKPLIEKACIEDVQIDHPEQVKQLIKIHDLKRYCCSFVLDTEDYQMVQVEAPSVPEQETHDALRWKLQGLLDYPVDQATLDYVKIPGDPANPNRQQYLYAITAQNAKVGPLFNHFYLSGLALDAIDVRVLAQRNLASCVEQEHRGLAMLSIGRKGGLLTFTANGELYHARFIDIPEEQSLMAIERIALELQRSLDHFDRQFPFVTISRLVLAPFDGREHYMEQLKQALYIHVDAMDLNDVFEMGEGVHLDDLALQGRFFPVLGAALRKEHIA